MASFLKHEYCIICLILLSVIHQVVADDDDEPTASPTTLFPPTFSPTTKTDFGKTNELRSPKRSPLVYVSSTCLGLSALVAGVYMYHRKAGENSLITQGIRKTRSFRSSGRSTAVGGGENNDKKNNDEVQEYDVGPMHHQSFPSPNRNEYVENEIQQQHESYYTTSPVVLNPSPGSIKQHYNSDSNDVTFSERIDNLRRGPIAHSRKSEEMSRRALKSLQQWEGNVLSVRTQGPQSYRAMMIQKRKDDVSDKYNQTFSFASKLFRGRSSNFKWRSPTKAYSGAPSVAAPSDFQTTRFESYNDQNGNSVDNVEQELSNAFPDHQRGIVALWVVANKLKEDFHGRVEEREITHIQAHLTSSTTAREFLLALQNICGTQNVSNTVEYARGRTSFKTSLVQAQQHLLATLQGENPSTAQL